MWATMRIFLFSAFVLLGMNASGQCVFDAVISPASLTLCPLQSDTLFAGPADSYQWFKNNLPVNGGTGPYLIVSALNDANASFQVVQTLNGCSELSPAVLVSVITPPALAFSVSEGSNGACVGDTLHLQITSSQSENITWYLNGQIIPGANAMNYPATTSGTYSVSAALAACPNQTQIAAGQSLTFTQAGVPVIYADNLNQQLYVEPAGISRNWMFEGQPLSGESNSILIPNQTGTYTAMVNFGLGCNRSSDPFLFEGFLAICEFEASIGLTEPGPVCPGTIVQISTNATSNIFWLRDGVAVVGETSSTWTVPADSIIGHEIKVVGSDGTCSDTSNALLLNILISVGPDILPNTNALYVCGNDSLLLQLDGGFTENITWHFNGMPIPNSDTTQWWVTTPGFYHVQAFSAVCGLQSAQSDTVFVQQLDNPIPELIIQGGSIVALPTDPGYQYAWSLNGNVVPGLSGSTILAQLGTWQVTITFNNGCVNTSEPLVYTALESIKQPAIEVFPNPAANEVHARLDAGWVYLYDMQGQLLQAARHSGGLYRLDLRELPAGIYWLNWKSQSHALQGGARIQHIR